MANSKVTIKKLLGLDDTKGLFNWLIDAGVSEARNLVVIMVDKNGKLQFTSDLADAELYTVLILTADIVKDYLSKEGI